MNDLTTTPGDTDTASAGIFDDLIPQNGGTRAPAAGGTSAPQMPPQADAPGMFDDLIPNQPQPTSPSGQQPAASSEEKKGGLFNNIAAGLNSGFVYQPLGAPVDAMTWLYNAAAAQARAISGAPVQNVEKPIGGSAWIGTKVNQATSAVLNPLGYDGVNDPANVEAKGPLERAARVAAEGAGAAFAPEAIVVALGRAGMLTPGAMQAFAPVLGDGTSAAWTARNMGIGAAGGVGAEQASSAAKEAGAGPLGQMAAGLAGGLAGGIGGDLAISGAGAAARGVGRAGQAGMDYFAPNRASQERVAGRMLREAASDPDAAAAKDLSQLDKVPGSEPTVAEAIDDTGLAGLQRAVEARNPVVFNQRRADQNAARVDALDNLQDAGHPEMVVKALRDGLSDIDARSAAAVDEATQAAQSATNKLGGTGNLEEYGASIRDAVVKGRDEAEARDNALWDAIDPDQTLNLHVGKTRQTARDVVKEMPKSAEPMGSKEAGIFRVAGNYPQVQSFRELKTLRTRVNEAMREEYDRNGSTTVYARLVRLRGAIENDIEGAVAAKAEAQARAVAAGEMSEDQTMAAALQKQQREWYEQRTQAAPVEGDSTAGAEDFLPSARGARAGAPTQGPALQPNFDEEAAGRVKVATDAARETAATYETRPIADILRQPAKNAPFNVPEASVASRFFHGGQTGLHDVKAMERAAKDPGTMKQVRDYAISDLRKKAMLADGTLDPAKVATWRANNKEALRAFPEIDDMLANPVRASEAVSRTAEYRKYEIDEYQKGIVGDLLKLDNSEDVVKTVGGIFGKRDAAAQMRRLRDITAGNADARAGLRKAIAEHINKHFISNTEVATSGTNKIKSDGFQNFIRRNEQALSAVFNGDEVANLKRIAADINRSERSINAAKIPGQSNTAQDLAAMKKGERSTLDIMLSAVGGTWAGGPVMGIAAALGAKAINAARQAGMKKVDDLVLAALLDPPLAQALMKKTATGKGTETLTRRLLHHALKSWDNGPLDKGPGGGHSPSGGSKGGGNGPSATGRPGDEPPPSGGSPSPSSPTPGGAPPSSTPKDTGPDLILSGSGKPMPTKGVSLHRLRVMGLDPKDYDLRPVDGGFVAVRKAEISDAGQVPHDGSSGDRDALRLGNTDASAARGAAEGHQQRAEAAEVAAPGMREGVVPATGAREQQPALTQELPDGAIPSGSGKPMPTKGAVNNRLRAMGHDPKDFDARPVEGGFVAVPKAPQAGKPGLSAADSGDVMYQSALDKGGRSIPASINKDTTLHPLDVGNPKPIATHEEARAAVPRGEAQNQSGTSVEITNSSVKKWYSKGANEIKRALAPHLVKAFENSVTYHEGGDGFSYAVGLMRLDGKDVGVRFVINGLSKHEKRLYQIEGVEVAPIYELTSAKELGHRLARGPARELNVADAVSAFNRIRPGEFPLFQDAHGSASVAHATEGGGPEAMLSGSRKPMPTKAAAAAGEPDPSVQGTGKAAEDGKPSSPRPIFDDMRSRLAAAGVPKKELDANAAVMEAYYQTRAKRLGVDAETLYREHVPDVRAGEARDFNHMKPQELVDSLVQAHVSEPAEAGSAGRLFVDPQAKTWDLFHGTTALNDFKRFDPSSEAAQVGTSLQGAERGVVFLTPNPEEAGRYASFSDPNGEAGARIFRVAVSPGKTAVFDIPKLMRSGDKRFATALKDAWVRHDLGANGRDLNTEIRAARAMLARTDMDRPAVDHTLGATHAAIDLARKEGLDTVVVRGLNESKGGDQVIVLNPDRVFSRYSGQKLYQSGAGETDAGMGLIENTRAAGRSMVRVGAPYNENMGRRRIEAELKNSQAALQRMDHAKAEGDSTLDFMVGYTQRSIESLKDAMDRLGPTRATTRSQPEGNRFKPSKVIPAGDDFVVRVATDARHGAMDDEKIFRIHKAPDSATEGAPSKVLGPSLGDVTVTRHPDGRWEVSYVHVRPTARRQGVAKALYGAVEKELGIDMHPSGILLPDGYAMWNKRAPELVKWHRKYGDAWLSPKHVLREITNTQQRLAQGGIADTERMVLETHARRLQEIIDGLPAEAKSKEALDRMFQADDATYRGAAILGDGRAVIELFKARDASTFMHEAGHVFLRDMVQDAAQSPAVKADLDAVLKWAGINDASKIRREHHEQFARGFEQYLRDGKAPSAGLKRAFAQFKEWLTSIYRSLTDLGQPIPANIRGVYDRLLSGDVSSGAAETIMSRSGKPMPTKGVALHRLRVLGHDPKDFELREVAGGFVAVTKGVSQAPASTGPFGPVHEQFQHNARAAIARLMADQDGEAVAALHHPDVGDIDLVWGKEPSKGQEGYGLAKIAAKHPEVLGDLQGFLTRLSVDPSRSGTNRIRLRDKTGHAVVRLDWERERKTWLLTAFEEKAGGSATTDTATQKVGDDTARPGTGTTNVAPHAPGQKPGSAVKPREDR